jgi:phosphoglycerate dehydrogenase-like enzyme
VDYRPKALFAMSPRHLAELFPPAVMLRLQQSAEIDSCLVAERFDQPEVLRALAETEVIVSGWGCPPIDAAVLAAAPRLRAVLHSAGSVKSLITSDCWQRGVRVSSAAEANAVPVAEYALAAILLAGKDVFGLRERYRERRVFTLAEIQPGVGNFGRSIGIIGASRIGRRVLELLKPFDFQVFLYDPYVDAATAATLGARPVELAELLSLCDIVSLHAPVTEETRKMIGADELALIRDGAVLINTARGELVDGRALEAELLSGRISAVLDVTDPEPVPASSALFDLPNVFLTPHVAGSHGNELARMGRSVTDELERLTAGLPLAHEVHESDLDKAA